MCLVLCACGQSATTAVTKGNDVVDGSEAVRLERISRDAKMLQQPEQPQQQIDHFVIEGSWLSVGSSGFGQAQPGMTVTFDGTHCNFFSPHDTYAFYQDDGQWKLDCTSFLFSETLTFKGYSCWNYCSC